MDSNKRKRTDQTIEIEDLELPDNRILFLQDLEQKLLDAQDAHGEFGFRLRKLVGPATFEKSTVEVRIKDGLAFYMIEVPEESHMVVLEHLADLGVIISDIGSQLFESNTARWWSAPDSETRLLIVKNLLFLPTVEQLAHWISKTPIVPLDPLKVKPELVGIKLKPQFRDACLFLKKELHGVLKLWTTLEGEKTLYHIREPAKARDGGLDPASTAAFLVEMQLPFGKKTMDHARKAIHDSGLSPALYPRLTTAQVRNKDRVSNIPGKFIISFTSADTKKAALQKFPQEKRDAHGGFYLQLVCNISLQTRNNTLALQRKKDVKNVHSPNMNKSFVDVKENPFRIGPEIPSPFRTKESQNFFSLAQTYPVFKPRETDVNTHLMLLLMIVKLLPTRTLLRFHNLIHILLALTASFSKILTTPFGFSFLLLSLISEAAAIKIITLNIGRPVTGIEESLALFIKQEDPDFVFLQEVHLTDIKYFKCKMQNRIPGYKMVHSIKSWKRTQKDYTKRKLLKNMQKFNIEDPTYINPDRAKPNGGVISFYRSTLNITEIDQNDKEQRVIRLTLTCNNQRTLLYNIYAPADGDKNNNNFFVGLGKKISMDIERLKQANSASPVSFIIAGDTNAKLDSEYDKKIQTKSQNKYNGYKNLINNLGAQDKWRELHPFEKEFTYCSCKDKQSEMQETRIDTFIAPGDRDVESVEIIDFKYAVDITKDHKPVIYLDRYPAFENDEPPEPARFSPKIRKRIIVEPGFKPPNLSEVAQFQYECFVDGPSAYRAQRYYSEWNRELSECIQANIKKGDLDESSPKKAFVNHRGVERLKQIKEALMKEIRTPSKDRRKAMEEINLRCKGNLKNLVGDPAEQQDLRKLAKQVDKKLAFLYRKLQRKHVNKCIERIKNFDLGSLCRHVKRESARGPATARVSITTNGVTSYLYKPWNMIKAFEDFWSQIYISKKQPRDWPGDQQYILDKYLSRSPYNEDDPNWVISEDDLSNALGRMPKGKAPGESQITSEILKAISEEQKKQLLKLFIFSLKNKWIPKEWKHTQTILIPKGNNTEDVTAYRPIALQEAPYKVFASILLEKALEHVSKHKTLSRLQFGGRRDTTITQLQLTFQAILEDANRHNREIFVIYFDFLKAFDTVEIWILQRTLRYYDFPEIFINIIGEIYKENTFELFTPLGSSDTKIKSTRGVKQGCVLSPLLFIVFMNPLLEALEKSGLGYTFQNNKEITIPALCYMDDLTAIANSHKDAATMIKIVEDFCYESGMAINTKKSQYSSLNTTTKKPLLLDGKHRIEYVPPEEAVRLLGIHYNMKLVFTQQEKITQRQLSLDILRITNRCYTLKQKCAIINTIITAKVASRLNTIIFSPDTLKKMDTMIKKCALKAAGLPQNMCGETVWRSYKNLGLNVNSVADLQVQCFMGTALNSGLNPDLQTYPRECLFQLMRDVYGRPDPQIDITPIEQNELCNGTFWNNLTGALGRVKRMDKTLELMIDEQNSKKVNITNFLRPPFNDKDFNLVQKKETTFIPVFTDGSIHPGSGFPGSAVFFNDTSPCNWKDTSAGKRTSFNAELIAIEVALALGPKDSNLMIFSDCLSAIVTVQKKHKYSELYKLPDRAAITRIQNAISERKEEGWVTTFEWIPSHTQEKGNISTKKQTQLDYLKETFGDAEYRRIVNANAKVDEMAKQGMMIMTRNENIIFKSPSSQPRTLANPLLPLGLPRVNLIMNGQAFQGNIRKCISQLQKEVHHKQKNEKNKKDARVNEKTQECTPTVAVIKSNDPQLDPVQRFLFQSLCNKVKTPKSLFRQAKSNNQDSFFKIRQGIIHNSPFCHEETCRPNTISDFCHMIKHPAAREETEKLEKEINKMVNTNRKRTENFTEVTIKPFWIQPEDPDVVMEMEDEREYALNKREHDIIDLGYCDKEWLKTRKKNQSLWDSKKSETRKNDDRTWGTRGLIPKTFYDHLVALLGSQGSARVVATDLIISEMKSWIKIRNSFWNNRMKQEREHVDLQALRIYRSKKTDR